MTRLDRLLHGPYPALPRPLDAVSEHWSRLRPRVRLLAVCLAVVVVALALDARIHAVESRWGGPPATVLVATRDLAVGDSPAGALRTVGVPPALAPADALDAAADDAILALALPRGAVLTTAHVSARGPARGLSPSLRVVPLPVQPGWGVVGGGWVDVWTVGGGEAASQHVASARPVVGVRRDTTGLTALVGLRAEEVEAVTAALAVGDVLLTHAPAPQAAAAARR